MFWNDSVYVLVFFELDTKGREGAVRDPANVQSLFGVRSGCVRASFEVCSEFVRGPLGVRSASVRSPLGVRSESVREPFGIRSTLGIYG